MVDQSGVSMLLFICKPFSGKAGKTQTETQA
jgi:hypothetical protein